MSMTLKKIQHAAFASEETECYRATLNVDGKPFAEVGNDGHGGCDFFHQIGRSYDDAMAIIKAQTADLAADYLADMNDGVGGFTFTADDATPANVLEWWCHNQLMDHVVAKTVRRDMKRKVLFTRPDEKGVFEMRYTGGKRGADGLLISKVIAKYPEAVVLNTLPIADAIAAYRAQA